MTQGALTHASLKAKQRALREGFPETMGLRVHRAISWIGRAEREADDPDAAFVFLWIAFNAAYAEEALFHDRPSSERAVFKDYFERLVALDRDNRIYAAIWQRFSGPIRLLMANRYLFNPFWEHHNGIDGYADWPDRFDKAGRAFATALEKGDTPRILSFLFDRLC